MNLYLYCSTFSNSMVPENLEGSKNNFSRNTQIQVLIVVTWDSISNMGPFTYSKLAIDFDIKFLIGFFI